MTPIEIAKIQEYLRQTCDNDRIFIDRNAMAVARQDLLAGGNRVLIGKFAATKSDLPNVCL